MLNPISQRKGWGRKSEKKEKEEMERKKEKEKNENQEKNKRKERRIPDQRSRGSKKGKEATLEVTLLWLHNKRWSLWE